MRMVKNRVAWGITGSGDRLRETVEVMKEVKDLYPNVEISVTFQKLELMLLSIIS